MNNAVFERICKIFRNLEFIAVDEEIGLTDNLSDNLGLDVADRIDLFYQIDEEFDIELDYTEFKNIQTMQELVNLVEGV